MKRGFTILGVVTALLLSVALYAALAWAPTEQTMGHIQRIFYYHVPSAWTAMVLFGINFLASVQFLVRSSESCERVAQRLVNIITLVVVIAGFVPVLVDRTTHALGFGLVQYVTTAIAIYITYGVIYAISSLIGKYFSQPATDILALVSAEVGVVFCTVVLVTGPIWARPVWGIWWDPADIRLNSTLALWLIYISYLILRRFSTSSRIGVIAAVWAIFGALDVPFVFFSIWFFRTQHPSPVIAKGGYLDPKMWLVVLINWFAFMCLAWLVCWTRYRLELAQRQVHEAESMQSLMEGVR